MTQTKQSKGLKTQGQSFLAFDLVLYFFKVGKKPCLVFFYFANFLLIINPLSNVKATIYMPWDSCATETVS